MDERGGVLAEHRDVGYLLDVHEGSGQVRGQLVLVGEGAGGSVDVDHRHCVVLTCYGAVATAAAACLISSVTACGWETIARWPDSTSVVVAPIRLANIRSASGGMAWSPVATRYP